jgi:hypothetical protein
MTCSTPVAPTGCPRLEPPWWRNGRASGPDLALHGQPDSRPREAKPRLQDRAAMMEKASGLEEVDVIGADACLA